jgi:hypothetical protein
VIPKGGKMLKFAENPDEYLNTEEGKKWHNDNPDYLHLQELLFNQGMRWGLGQDLEQPHAFEGFLENLKSGRLLSAGYKLAPWLAQGIVRPLFEHYIPRAKWVLGVKMLADKLEQYSEALANGDITEDTVARRVVAAIENRFGEFNYGRLYWDNTVKAAIQLAFRAPSWKYGTVATAVTAGKEMLSSQIFDDGMKDAFSHGSGPRQFSSRLPQLGLNAGGILSASLVIAALGTAMAKMLTGRWPWEWAQEDHKKNGLSLAAATALEMAHFRTGGHDKYGQPNRFTFPTDFRDYEHMALNPGSYIHGSLSDPVAGMLDSIQNRDYFGNYVFNPNDPLYKEFLQGLQYNAKNDFGPISLSNALDKNGPQDTGSKVQRALGLTGGTPKQFDRSNALNRAISLVHAGDGPKTPEEVAQHEMAKEHPTQHQARIALREKDMPYLERIFMMQPGHGGLTYEQKSEIYNKYATPEERAMLAPLMRRVQAAMISQARRSSNASTSHP